MKVFLKSFIFIFLIIPTISYSYEPYTTHAGLTQEIVDFYNFFSYPKITEEEKELIIQGSIDEDFPNDRPLNHFYDPVRNIGFNNFPTSKQWASGEIINNDFSWQDALNAYARGDEEVAFKTLGHIIHLIEDMGVPDHTRNDPHKGDGIEGVFTNESPYEKWANDNKGRQTLKGLYLTFVSEGITPKRENSLGDYFDFLANYSNRNFFSRDSIKGELYKYNEPLEVELIGDYMYGVDEYNGKKIKLYIYLENINTGKVERILMVGDDTSVLSSYFDRLSRQIVPVGAGVIELFFKEAEEAKKKYQKEREDFKAKEELRQKELLEANQKLSESGFWDKAKYKIQYVWEYNLRTETFAVAKYLREFINEGPINLSQQSFYVYSAIGHSTINIAALGVVKTEEEVKRTNEFVQKQNPTTLAVGPVFAFSNELNTNNSQPTNETVTNNSQLTNGQSTPESNFIPTLLNPIQNPLPGGGGGAGFGGGMPPREVTVSVLEEATTTATTTEEVTPEIPPPDVTPPDISVLISECVYSLVVGSCVIATSTINISWTSVATDTAHYALSVDNVLSATTTETGSPRNISAGAHTIKVLAYDQTGNVGTSSEITIEYIARPLVISEIAWAGMETNFNNEWLEIYNRSNHTVNLNGVSIKSIDGGPDIELSGSIGSHSYYLIERTDDDSVPYVSADLIVPFSGSGPNGLGNTGEQLEIIHKMGGISVIIDMTPAVSTCSGWCFGNTSNYGTMARSNLNGLGSVSSSWATDDNMNETIFNASALSSPLVYVVLSGTPKSVYIYVPPIIVPF
ncbi:MAG: hypothetical protein AAB513_01170 [Patescibacteria group bacterium]